MLDSLKQVKTPNLANLLSFQVHKFLPILENLCVCNISNIFYFNYSKN